MTLIFLLFTIFSPPVQAAPRSLDMTIQEGFNGMVKNGRGYPVTITLKNTGADFSGDMLIDFAVDYNLGGQKAIRVELPQGSEKTYEVIIPGASYEQANFGNELIKVYENNWKKGKKVKLNGTNKSSARMLEPHQPTIGLLSENPDRMRNLQLIRLNDEQITVVPLSKESIPTNESGLEFFDYLIIDDYSIGELSDQQQEALVNWVESGGSLIAGASSKGNHAFGELSPLLPLQEKAEETISDLSFLGDQAKNDLSSIKITTGDLLANAEVVESSEEYPVVIKTSVNNGEILQTAYSIGEAPLSGWNGYADYLEKILLSIQPAFGQKTDGIYQSIYWDIGETNELFPSSNFSIAAVILIMIAYMVVIIPIMYFVLRHMDMREHSWWLIPVISILLSIGIFAIGAKDRLAKAQLSELGLLRADGQGNLTGPYSVAIFSNRSGDYELSLPREEFKGVPVNSQDSIIDRVNHVVLSESVSKNDYYFSDVDYWSGRSVVGIANKQSIGQLNIDLAIHGSELRGTIENQFPFDFEELYIWTGAEIYELGAINENQKIEINQSLTQTLMTRPIDIGNLSYGLNQELDELKKEHLRSALVHSDAILSENSPIVFGYTKSNVLEADIKNKKAKNERLQMIYQAFQADGEVTGPFTITPDQIGVEIKVISGHILEPLDMYNEVALENGEYELNLSLPRQIHYSKAAIDFIDYVDYGYSRHELSFLDQESGEYVDVDDQNQSDVLGDRPERFISEQGQIIIRLKKTDGEENPFFSFPEFTVKGAVNP